jgi:peroxiredoxin
MTKIFENTNKKRAIHLIVVFITIFVFYMLIYIANNHRYKHINIDKLMKIELTDQLGNSSTIFQSEKTVIVLYFKTSCQHCIDEINAIAGSIEEFNKVELFLVSSESQDRITEFVSNFEIDKQCFFRDKTGELKHELNVKSYPSIFIFSKEKKLIKQFKGAVSIEKIISELPYE